MSSTCLSGGGRTYALDLELEMIKSPSTSTRTSHSSSPSSTLSGSSNSPLAISTRKPRRARKRPKQTYNEAAALLSTAYPKIFSTNHLSNPSKFTKPHQLPFFDESSELLLPSRVFDNSGFLLHKPIHDKPRFPFERKAASSNGSGEVVDSFQGNHSPEFSGNYDFPEDLDAESILDEEIEEGIDSIMGNLSVDKDHFVDESSGYTNSWFGNPMGIGFVGQLIDFRFGMRSGVSAWRHVDEGNWWSFPSVNLHQISPKPFNKKKPVSSEKKKKKKKVDQKEQKQPPVAQSKMVSELNSNESPSSVPKQANSAELLLKLKYDDVLTAWSDRGTPFLDESLSSDVQGNDLSARLAHIDLFSESGVREACVLRYKEKRRTRLFSKKIRYQVRKVNADRRLRMKGRFVRRPNSSTCSQDGKTESLAF